MGLRQRFSKWLLEDVWGWEVIGDYPHHIKKSIVLAAPHTSNWDFPIGILLRNAYQFQINFVGKASLFRGPLGPLMRWLEGVPVERGKGGFVVQMIEQFKKRDRLVLNIAPEGTRKKVDHFKSGFYHIALGAGVPVLLIRFDWGRKQLVWSEPIYVTGDQEREMREIEAFFRDAQGYHAEYSLDPEPPATDQTNL